MPTLPARRAGDSTCHVICITAEAICLRPSVWLQSITNMFIHLVSRFLSFAMFLQFVHLRLSLLLLPAFMLQSSTICFFIRPLNMPNLRSSYCIICNTSLNNCFHTHTCKNRLSVYSVHYAWLYYAGIMLISLVIIH